MQHADAQPMKRFSSSRKGPCGILVYAILNLKFEMLQLGEDEIKLHKWSGGTAHLRTLEEALTQSIESIRFDISPRRSCQLMKWYNWTIPQTANLVHKGKAGSEMG